MPSSLSANPPVPVLGGPTVAVGLAVPAGLAVDVGLAVAVVVAVAVGLAVPVGEAVAVPVGVAVCASAVTALRTRAAKSAAATIAALQIGRCRTSKARFMVRVNSCSRTGSVCGNQTTLRTPALRRPNGGCP